MSGLAATGRIRAVPRHGCCAGSGVRRVPSCAAGSWSSPKASRHKISKTTPCKVERAWVRLAGCLHKYILAKGNYIFDNGKYRGDAMSQPDSEQEVAAGPALHPLVNPQVRGL